MEGRGEMMWSFLSKKEISKADDPEEIELAYWLQNLTGNDPSGFIRLINRYAGILYQWVEVLLYHRWKVAPSREEVLSQLENVFEYASRHAEQFSGNQSITNWLFTNSSNVLSQGSRHSRRRDGLSENDQPFYEVSENQSSYPNLTKNLSQLRKNDWKFFILR